MTDDNVKFDELTTGELSDVKGGIPYEKPLLISFEDAKYTCSTGVACNTGDGDSECKKGMTCRAGIVEDPEV